MSAPTACANQYVGTRDQGCLPAIASPKVVAGLKWPPESTPKAETATESPRPCASAMATRLSPPVAMIAPAPTKKNRKVPATSARRARTCPVMRRLFCTHGRLPPRRGEQGAHPDDSSGGRRHAGRGRERGVGRDHRRSLERFRELAPPAPARPLEARGRQARRVGVGLHLGLAVVRPRGRDLQNPLRLARTSCHASTHGRSGAGT